MRKKAAIGQRGQHAQTKVREFLQALSNQFAGFDFARIYDARSSMGRIPRQPGDYSFFAPTHHGLLEVKETEHDFRLSKDKLSQIPGLHKRELAGGKIAIVVLHTRIDRWRLIPFKWIYDRREQTSWDLTEFPQYEKVADLHGFRPFLVGSKGFVTA